MLIKRLPLGRSLNALTAFVDKSGNKFLFPVLGAVLMMCTLCSLGFMIAALIAFVELFSAEMNASGAVSFLLLDLGLFGSCTLVMIASAEATIVFLELIDEEYYVKEYSDEGEGFLRKRWELELIPHRRR